MSNVKLKSEEWKLLEFPPNLTSAHAELVEAVEV